MIQQIQLKKQDRLDGFKDLVIDRVKDDVIYFTYQGEHLSVTRHINEDHDVLINTYHRDINDKGYVTTTPINSIQPDSFYQFDDLIVYKGKHTTNDGRGKTLDQIDKNVFVDQLVKLGLVDVEGEQKNRDHIIKQQTHIQHMIDQYQHKVDVLQSRLQQLKDMT